MEKINKELFLSTLSCPTYGWLLRYGLHQKQLSPAEKLKIKEGMEIHKKARCLFPNGVLVSGNNQTCINRTKELLSNPAISIIFEATFQTGPFITKADILIRQGMSQS